MIPDIRIPTDKQPEIVLASLIRLEATLLTMSDQINAIQAAVEKRSVESVEDDFDGEYVKKLKDLARKLNELYSPEEG